MSGPVRSLLCFLLLSVVLTGCSRNAEKRFEVSTDGSSQTPMLATSSAVVVANEAGYLTRIGHDGTVLWRVPAGQPLASRPVEARGMVVATSVAGDWFGTMASNGKVPWRLPRQPLTKGDLLTDGAKVFAVLGDGTVRALDPTSGAILWTRPGPGKPPSGSAVRAGTILAVPLGDAGIFATAWEDGTASWRAPVDAVGLVASSDGSRIYAATSGGELKALAASSGEVVWTQPLGAQATTRPRLLDSRVYVGVDKTLRAFDAATGEPRETITLDAPVAPPVRTPDVFVVPTSGLEGKVYLFRPGQLEPYAHLRLDSPIRQAPVVVDDTLIVLASDGRVLGYKLKPPRR